MNKTFLLLIFLVSGSVSPAKAIDLFKGVMPGEVASAHEKLEGQCTECHTLGGKKIYFDKCLTCHKEAKTDVETMRGYHGKIDAGKCETCHKEHKGRNAPLVVLEPQAFNHLKTEYPLAGKHQKSPCKGCHLKPKYRETPRDCYACHKKDDKHKEELGRSCEKCHNPASWKEISFDHGKTHFPLEGKHKPLDCGKCHAPGKPLKIETTCVSCHKKEDKHKGALGPSCERCHVAAEWKKIRFDHSKTEFPLEGKHLETSCEKCHTGPKEKFKETPKACFSCHQKDDKHKGSQGKDCKTCHKAASWKEVRFDHDRTQFKLVGSHQKTECEKCHKTPQLKETPKVCYECHKKDDKHKGAAGETCDRCHRVSEKWKEIVFDHNLTKYPLLDKHLEVSCKKCHGLEKFKVSSVCSNCHLKDDPHKRKLGEQCQNCHVEKSWKEVGRFDHQKTDFRLEGKHIKTECKRCHETQVFKFTPKKCNDCHKKDDYHKGTLGPKCDFCHTADTWKRKDFDHFKETGYALRDQHRNVKCEKCHTGVLFAEKTSMACFSCHQRDDVHDGELGPRCELCHIEKGFIFIKKDSLPGR
ncbi:MAG TPA: cytochrome c3 family protein [Nitrospiria bacterium]|nr:cytochrome c3 family protein [Nitrospiria bacterium]